MTDDGDSPIKGYILHYKRESGEWEEFRVSHKVNTFVLSRLWCGNDYQVYMTAYNRIGMGKPSKIFKATTKGSKPDDSPGNGDKFVTVNVSWITLHLSMWNDGGCPITYFELEYKKSGESIWTLVSNNIEVSKWRYHFAAKALHLFLFLSFSVFLSFLSLLCENVRNYSLIVPNEHRGNNFFSYFRLVVKLFRPYSFTTRNL